MNEEMRIGGPLPDPQPPIYTAIEETPIAPVVPVEEDSQE